MPIGRIGQDFIVNTTTALDQLDPSVTALADGRFVVTWYSFDPGDGSETSIRARIYNADGSAAGSDFIVNTTTAGLQRDTSTTALDDGRFVVTWESSDGGDGDGGCIRARLYNADGSAIGNDFIVNSTTADDQNDPSITALDNGRFLVTWRSFDPGDGSATCIRARLYNADGSATGDDFIVNTTTTAGQGSPSARALADGRFVVTWYSNEIGDGSESCIRGRIFNADGSAASNDFVMNLTGSGHQFNPSIAVLANGSFVVMWDSSDTGDGEGTCVRGRVYNADGSAASNDFIVNTTATGNQIRPAVTALADGRFVVTWQSADTGDGSGSCIRARLYNADGSAIGNDFIVNTTGMGGQAGPSVAALADGRFVVTWQSADTGDGSGWCIRSQIFDPTLFAGTSDDDIWHGGSLGDDIFGGAGNDILYGQNGNDVMDGEEGDDNLHGGAGNDTLYGGGGNDLLNGGAGNDTMTGGAGNDIYIVAAAGDQTIEAAGGGVDTVRSYINWTLAENVERLELMGSGNLNGTGNALDNSLVGNAGNNLLNGGAGNDTMTGGAGNDIYIVAAAGDQTIEAAGGGTDTVRSYIGWTLAENVERLELQGSGNLNGTGNALNNTLVGNAGNNTLGGGAGNDWIVGGAGNDTLIGGAGNDSFVFNAALSWPNNTDTISDFSVADDRIVLENAIFTGLAAGALAAGAFHIGAGAAAADDRIIYNSSTGALYFDADGSGGAGMVQFATIGTGLALTASDFLVV